MKRSIELLPGIELLDPESLTYSIYMQLYNSFFNSQDKKDDDHPFGIVEGDQTSIRLRNTAYNFANVISSAVSNCSGGGGDGEISLTDLVKKSGDDMSGILRANYGFEAGIENNRILFTYKEDQINDQGEVISSDYGIKIDGQLNIGANSLLFDGKNILSYDKIKNVVFLSGEAIDVGSATIKTTGSIIIESKNSKVTIGSTAILINNKQVFHEGNANLNSVDWSMQNANVSGKLSVSGETNLNGTLNSLKGVNLGSDGKNILSIKDSLVTVNGFISFGKDYGIKLGDIPVLILLNEKDVQLGAANGDLLLGSEEHTKKIRLLSNLCDIDGDNVLISRYGAAYFPDSLKVSHKYGNILLSSYRVDDSDEGMIVHKALRFGSDKGAYFENKEGDKIQFVGSVKRYEISTGKEIVDVEKMSIGVVQSNSIYAPTNKNSNTISFYTDADFYSFNKAIESKKSIGIEGSSTRLLKDNLFFSNTHQLLAVTGGIKHYGDALFLNNISSEYFSSGFAGAGWAIKKNETTGRVVLTVDEAVIRNKLRTYEHEVQKISATNGALWISDSCSADSVIKL